jgi:hypothetical protein
MRTGTDRNNKERVKKLGYRIPSRFPRRLTQHVKILQTKGSKTVARQCILSAYYATLYHEKLLPHVNNVLLI